jgi:aspartate/methionine/tyrosine aminotransferase
LGVGQPDWSPAPHIVEAAIKALRDGHHGYTPAPGLPSLRRAVALSIFERTGVDVEPGRIFIIPGAKIGIFFTILLFGEPGAEIIYPDPGFPIFRSMIEYTGATPVPVPLRSDRAFVLDHQAVLELISPRTRLIIVNSPANPTGAVTPQFELDRLATALESHPHVTVLSDEIYGRLSFGDSNATSWLAYRQLHDRLIVLDGWSKTYGMTGWRLGYCVIPSSLIEPMQRLAINCHTCAATVAQYAGEAALTGSQDLVAQVIADLRAKRDLIAKALNAIPGVHCDVPEGAFYVFPNFTRVECTAQVLQDRLLKAGVVTIAGSGFGQMGEGHLRMSYATRPEVLIEASRRIAESLALRQPS